MGHISRRVRAVTHLDITRDDIERAIEIVRSVF
jgi:threonine aldolase